MFDIAPHRPPYPAMLTLPRSAPHRRSSPSYVGAPLVGARSVKHCSAMTTHAPHCPPCPAMPRIVLQCGRPQESPLRSLPGYGWRCGQCGALPCHVCIALRRPALATIMDQCHRMLLGHALPCPAMRSMAEHGYGPRCVTMWAIIVVMSVFCPSVKPPCLTAYPTGDTLSQKQCTWLSAKEDSL